MDHCHELIKWRVEGVGVNNYNARKASRDEVLERRAAMRKLLIGTQFNNSSNEQLDCMRIEYTPYGYIVEDSNGNETVIRYKRTLDDAATSTRACNSTTHQ
ncbi:hypothetical protein [Clostridium sp. Marseille-P299]|uniref:hypothetical protein n=1 Tax=Clostridium sp. Marseille-P299 TaxID=1805477 RepID=UPI00082A38E3|nr:hypothetical protein [Clostridium sp. Marseille-P299]